ncbi:MAG: hypothetical protein JKY27_06070 [Magnetovibrio sp.]|nr:hypothetical protein [Magnetovibrio sp.]
MLWSKGLVAKTLVSLALISVAALQSGCGYRPLYAQNTNVPHTAQQLNLIEIKPITDRVGQMMRTAVQRRIAPKAQKIAKQYDLQINLTESIATLAVEESAFATRANLHLRAQFQLINKTDRKQLLDGTVKTVSSYNILSSDFATISARKDARKRAVEDLAASLQTRLAIYFNGPGAKTSPSQQRTGYR